jgi:hypothetical protein
MIITTPRRYLDHTNTIAFLQSSRRAAYHPNKKKHFAKILFWACSPLRRSTHTSNPYKKKVHHKQMSNNTNQIICVWTFGIWILTE